MLRDGRLGYTLVNMKMSWPHPSPNVVFIDREVSRYVMFFSVCVVWFVAIPDIKLLYGYLCTLKILLARAAAKVAHTLYNFTSDTLIAFNETVLSRERDAFRHHSNPTLASTVEELQRYGLFLLAL